VNELSAEATGETAGEAKWKALRDLERMAQRLGAQSLDKASVRFQVVSEGERGLLGVGSTPARVIATADATESVAAPAPRPDESEAESHMRGLVERVVGAMGVDARVDARETEDGVLVTCDGEELGLLIGKHGQTIDALQYVANAALYRSGAGKPVTVDAAGYRERRRQTLEGIAVQAAERAGAGERVLLEAMTAAERRVVHERLKDAPGVQTASEGTEPNRYVVVLPA
jgi:spoIIIJ-associated protein